MDQNCKTASLSPAVFLLSSFALVFQDFKAVKSLERFFVLFCFVFNLEVTVAWTLPGLTPSSPPPRQRL